MDSLSLSAIASVISSESSQKFKIVEVVHPSISKYQMATGYSFKLPLFDASQATENGQLPTLFKVTVVTQVPTHFQPLLPLSCHHMGPWMLTSIQQTQSATNVAVFCTVISQY
jgi:hypothetical protein